MNYRNITLAAICLAVVTVSDRSVVWAQLRARPTADRRLRPGRGFWANERTARNIRHARDYSRSLHKYACEAEKVIPQVAKSESTQLGKHIDAAMKEVAAARKVTKGNQDSLVAQKAIAKHLDMAAKAHKALHEECCKDAMDRMACARHCSMITKELDKAKAEHRALVRSIELRRLQHNRHSKSSSKKK